MAWTFLILAFHTLSKAHTAATQLRPLVLAGGLALGGMPILRPQDLQFAQNGFYRLNCPQQVRLNGQSRKMVPPDEDPISFLLLDPAQYARW